MTSSSTQSMATATRHGAVLFTDIVGFTEYTGCCGDAAALEVLDRQAEIVASVVTPAGGRVVKELGDGLLVWFDDVARALGAAAHLTLAVEAARNDGSFPLALRMGLHCGEVVARGDDVIGHTVNVAARVADLAGPGELLVSDAVVATAGMAPASFRPVGPTHVKGVADPIWLHRHAP
jgi:adenylate cyclase